MIDSELTHRSGLLYFVFYILAAIIIPTLAQVHIAIAGERGVCWESELHLGALPVNELEGYWGIDNTSVLYDEVDGIWLLRVFIPKGSIDPGSMLRKSKHRGGAGFKLRALAPGVSHAVLSYKVRFPVDFDFVRGGKLPGLFGGKGNSGGKIPDGTDGFSFRLMWGPNGIGTVYAYLPTSTLYGTNLLKGKFRFTPGRWHEIKQEVLLNSPGVSNGVLRMWIDNQFIGEIGNLSVRSVSTLKIEGLFFDVFFGGNDMSWASTQDTYIDFADFTLRGIEDAQ